MSKKVWLWNHYATNMYFDKAGRHYWFAENLKKLGYEPTIFCASTSHFSNDHIDTLGSSYIKKQVNNIEFVFINTPEYNGNGKKRVINILSFYKNILSVSGNFAKENGMPSVIIASSVHPLTQVAGIKTARKFGIPCVCEIRDLWPESLVAYGSLRRESALTKLLYRVEKWVYQNADKLIFTMEGGRDYILDRGWNDSDGIDITKVEHINNGVDLKTFNLNTSSFKVNDVELNDISKFKVIYTGSIRKVNDVEFLLEVAKELKNLNALDIKILIYGDGDDRLRLIRKCEIENIDNISFQGRVSKEKVPYILSKSDLNILHFQQNSIKKYGASLNKLFEYFASGKPVISDCEFGYDLIKRYNCGFVKDQGTPREIAEEIIKIKEMPKEQYDVICENGLIAAKKYNFTELTDKLINVIGG